MMLLLMEMENLNMMIGGWNIQCKYFALEKQKNTHPIHFFKWNQHQCGNSCWEGRKEEK